MTAREYDRRNAALISDLVMQYAANPSQNSIRKRPLLPKVHALPNRSRKPLV